MQVKMQPVPWAASSTLHRQLRPFLPLGSAGADLPFRSPHGFGDDQALGYVEVLAHALGAHLQAGEHEGRLAEGG